MTALEPGTKAPPIALQDQSGDMVSLEDMRGSKVLVYFYPKANTPGCTIQSCAVRDALADLADHGVKAIGISPDGPKAQMKFDQKYSLGFPLLCDEDHAVAEAYGVWREKAMYGKKYLGILRSSFLIDEDGVLLDAWYKVSPKDTVPNVLKRLGLA